MSQFSPIIWAPGIKLRLSGLALSVVNIIPSYLAGPMVYLKNQPVLMFCFFFKTVYLQTLIQQRSVWEEGGGDTPWSGFGPSG